MNLALTIIKATSELIKNAVSFIFNGIKSVISGVFKSIKNTITSIWNSIYAFLKNILNNILSIIKSITNSIKSVISKVFNGVYSSVTSIWNKIKSAMTKPVESAVNFIREQLNKLKKMFSKLQLKLPKIKLPHFKISGSFNVNPPSVPSISVNWYAKGGIFNGPSIIGVGEAGTEAVIPIDKLNEIIEKALKKANGGNLTLHIENFINNTEKDIEKLAYELEFYRQRVSYGRGGI